MILDQNAAVRFSKSPSSVIPHQKELVMNPSNLKRPAIVRIWRRRTPRDHADEYEAYNYEVGIKPLSKKALGVQTLREDRENETEFMTISYWESVEAMSKFARGDPRESTSRTGQGIPDRTPEGGADPAPSQEPWCNRLCDPPQSRK